LLSVGKSVRRTTDGSRPQGQFSQVSLSNFPPSSELSKAGLLLNRLPKLSEIECYIPFVDQHFPNFVEGPMVRWDKSLSVLVEGAWQDATNWQNAISRLDNQCKQSIFSGFSPIVMLLQKNVTSVQENIRNFHVMMQGKQHENFKNPGAQRRVWEGLLKNKPEVAKMRKSIKKLCPQNLVLVDLCKINDFSAKCHDLIVQEVNQIQAQSLSLDHRHTFFSSIRSLSLRYS
jgi:hypothetical protein